MAVVAFAIPVLPGKSDRVAKLEEELGPVWGEYEELNRQATVSRHLVFLQHMPLGDVMVNVLEVGDPSKIARRFSDSAYDRWFIDYTKDVVGIDPPP
jgi:hypothetical protein